MVNRDFPRAPVRAHRNDLRVAMRVFSLGHSSVGSSERVRSGARKNNYRENRIH